MIAINLKTQLNSIGRILAITQDGFSVKSRKRSTRVPSQLASMLNAPNDLEREAWKESLRHQDSRVFVVRCLEGDSVFVVVEPRQILKCPSRALWEPRVLS
jgi:hypothetical protein